MVLNTVTLENFGGHSHSVKFASGLNVLVGPNDVGKSTLFNSIVSALFIPSTLNRRLLQDFQQFLPLNGDTAKVTLEFTHDAVIYKLHKSWGAISACSLTSSKGLSLNTDDSIQETLLELLPAFEATMRNILLTHQSKLSQTLSDLNKADETKHSLADIFRSATLKTDGLSMERLNQRLEQEVDAYFSHWDLQLDSPERRPGNQRWRVKVGNVLKAFYQCEDLKELSERATRIENQLAELNSKVSETEKRKADAQKFMEANRAIIEGLGQKETLELQHKQSEERAKHLRSDFANWSNYEAQKAPMPEDIERAKQKVEGLTQEFREARIESDLKALRERLLSIDKAKTSLNSAKDHLESQAKITPTDFDRLRQAHQKLLKLEASITSSKLLFKITAKKPFTARIKADLGAETERTFTLGETTNISAAGQISFLHSDFEIVVNSGDGQFANLESQYLKAKEEFASLLTAFGVQDIQAAGAVHATYAAASLQYEACVQTYQNLLGTETYEGLVGKLNGGKRESSGRSIDLINAELQAAAAEHTKLKGKLEDLVAKLNDLTKRYANQDRLVELMVKENSETTRLYNQIQALPALPTEVNNSMELKQRYRQAEITISTAHNEIGQLISKIHNENLQMPEESAQELQSKLDVAKQQFEAAKNRGMSFLRIQKVVKDVEAEVGSADIYGPYAKELAKYISRLTTDRYQDAELEDALPTKLKRKSDGVNVPYQLLSAGMKDALSLGLKMTMASYFLKGKKGFLILDDPLVDLDEERQMAAATVINEYAQNAQVIVMTCHQTCSQKLGGNSVRLTF